MKTKGLIVAALLFSGGAFAQQGVTAGSRGSASATVTKDGAKMNGQNASSTSAQSQAGNAHAGGQTSTSLNIQSRPANAGSNGQTSSPATNTTATQQGDAALTMEIPDVASIVTDAQETATGTVSNVKAHVKTHVEKGVESTGKILKNTTGSTLNSALKINAVPVKINTRVAGGAVLGIH